MFFEILKLVLLFVFLLYYSWIPESDSSPEVHKNKYIKIRLNESPTADYMNMWNLHGYINLPL